MHKVVSRIFRGKFLDLKPLTSVKVRKNNTFLWTILKKYYFTLGENL